MLQRDKVRGGEGTVDDGRAVGRKTTVDANLFRGRTKRRQAARQLGGFMVRRRLASWARRQASASPTESEGAVGEQ